MKKGLLTTKFLFIFMIMTLFLGCSIYIPGDFDYGVNHYKIILDITPDDSSVFLNGKLVGLAYEFSTSRTALKFKNPDREVVIKKKGFLEKVLVPSQYIDGYSNSIIIKSSLSKDPYFEKTRSTQAPQPAEKSEYKAKSVKVEEIKKPEKELPENDPVFELTKGSLEISHTDASIFIDDEFFGVSPPGKVINNLHLKPGSHKITVFKPGFKIFTKKLLVTKEAFKIKVVLIK